ncbi:MAG TPA: allantoinase AllB [Pyrinomonadaceae bacterium]|nr:allantoinase AllB [Pyrinomonadaceae bacterium]
MSGSSLVIRSKQVVLPKSIAPASIHIADGIITAVGPFESAPAGGEVIETGDDSVVMPGLVDSHVHINEPGRTEWEGFASATRAAAAGGVTTLVDMPLNSIPPTTTVAGLREKLDAARDKCFVDVGFWGGVIPGNTEELGPLLDEGVVGFKCFLIHSGVDEFPNVTEADLRAAMPELTRLGAVLIVHAEVPGPINSAGMPGRHSSDGPKQTRTDLEVCPTKYKTFLASRPRAAENEAVELMIRMAKEFGTRVHIVHHSSADALPMLRQAKFEGLKITAETCPHYLTFAAEEIPDGATEYKCCPPVREAENREQLWDALGNETIDMIVSDHSPCPPDRKLRDSGDFLAAWGGISSLQLRLPIVWTEARRRGYSLETVTRWLCSAPAGLAGLGEKKGAIVAGYDADLVVWNPTAQFKVNGASLYHRHKLTPYEGKTLDGLVETTFLRGRRIYDGGELIGEATGLLLGAVPRPY